MNWTKAIRAGLTLGLAVLIGEVLYVAVSPNFYALQSGQCYRCSQPTPDFLEGRCKLDGVRTIINLRGENSGKDWYDAERAAAAKLGVTMIDIPLSSNCPPTTEEFRRLISLIDDAPRPLLFHCHSGSDRTGLAAMMYLLLQSDCSVKRAREEISFRYGHKFWSEAARLWAIPDAYEEWLAKRGETHSSAKFREWGTTAYHRRDMWIRLNIDPPVTDVD